MAEQDLLERAKRWVRERLEELYSLIEERDRLRAALEGGEGQPRASRRASRQRGRPNTERSADHAAGNLGEWNTGSHAFDANSSVTASAEQA